jgi:SAM-dependent methyltransferase
MATDAVINASNADQIAHWNGEVGRKWVAFQDATDRMLSGLTAQLFAAADIRPGGYGIDVGCGCGTTSLELAARVGTQGRVLGIDISEPMLTRARELAQRDAETRAPLTFVCEDAASYPFEPGVADMMISRFGLMFFAEPLTAFRNLIKALKSATGSLTFLCWRTMKENPWVTFPLGIAQRHVEFPKPGNPSAPGPFALGDGERLHRLMTDSGWKDIQLEPVEDNMVIGRPGLFDEAFAFATRIGPLAQILRDAANDDVRGRICTDLKTELKAHEGPEGTRLMGRAWLVTARAP